MPSEYITFLIWQQVNSRAKQKRKAKMYFSNPKVQRQGFCSHMNLRAVYLDVGKPDRRTFMVNIMNAGFLYGTN